MCRPFLIAIFMLALAAVNPLAASNLSNGGKIYRTNCAKCHGPSGKSLMAGVPDFDRPGSLMQSEQKLLTRIQSGRNACPAYRGILSEQEIFDVIAYIRSLSL